MIGAIRTVTKKELREALRDRRTLVNSLLFGPVLVPLFFILVLKLALSRSVATQDELVPVTIVNAAAAPNLVQQLRENGLDVSLREHHAIIEACARRDGEEVESLIRTALERTRHELRHLLERELDFASSNSAVGSR